MTSTVTISARLEQDQKDALRGGQRVRLATVRRARAALKNAEIAARGELDEDAAVKALRGLARQHRESIEQFRAGGRDDLVAREEQELAVLEGYLPAALEGEALERLVAEAVAESGATGPADIGRVMRAAMARAGGRADGGTVKTIAQRRLEDL